MADTPKALVGTMAPIGTTLGVTGLVHPLDCVQCLEYKSFCNSIPAAFQDSGKDGKQESAKT